MGNSCGNDAYQQFCGVSIPELYDCSEDDLPETTTVSEFGRRLHHFVTDPKYGNKYRPNGFVLSKQEAMVVAGSLRIMGTKRKNAGLIPLKKIRDEDCVMSVEMIRDRSKNHCIEYEISKSQINEQYSRLQDDILCLKKDNSRMYVVLAQKEKFYHLLAIPSITIVYNPCTQDGDKVDLSGHTPADMAYGIPNTQQHGDGSGIPRQWCFNWQQFRTSDYLEQSTEGYFSTTNEGISMRAVSKLFKATRMIKRDYGLRNVIIGGGNPQDVHYYTTGTGAAVTYTYNNQDEKGIDTVSHVIPRQGDITFDQHKKRRYGIASTTVEIIEDRELGLQLNQFQPNSSNFEVCATEPDMGFYRKTSHLTQQAVGGPVLKNGIYLQNINYLDGVTTIRNIPGLGNDVLSLDPPTQAEFKEMDSDNNVIMCGYPTGLTDNLNYYFKPTVKTLISFKLQMVKGNSSLMELLANVDDLHISDRTAVGIGQMGSICGLSGSHVIRPKDENAKVLAWYCARCCVIWALEGVPETTEVGLFIMRNSQQLCNQFGGNSGQMENLLRSQYGKRTIEKGIVTSQLLLPTIPNPTQSNAKKENGLLDMAMKGFAGVGVVTVVGLIGY